MNLIYKGATIDDIEILTDTRIEVLEAANQLSEDVGMSEVRKQSYDYYKESLADGTHTAYPIYDGDIVAGAGSISYYRIMPTYYNVSGNKTYIMNMYTNPNYRRKGIAYKTLKLLVDDARKRGITHIPLEATDMGRPLYEKFGFVKINDEMGLPNN